MTLRKKLIIVSVLAIIALQTLSVIQIPFIKNLEREELVNATIEFLFVLVGTIWALWGHIRKQTILPVLTFPAIISFIVSLFLEIGVFQDAVRVKDRTIGLGLLLFAGVGLYILLLTTNILLVSYYKRIPLERAARASNYVFTLIGIYFSILLLVNLEVTFFLKIIAVFVSILYYTFSNVWHLHARLKDNVIQSLSIALVTLIIFIGLSLWPIPAQFFALVLTLFSYMFLGLALEQKSAVGRAVWIEYSILILVITVILFKASIWGINGTFLGL